MAEERLGTEIRRDQIAATALELLGTRSVGELSMADIARRLGLASSAIYRHFRSKDEVLDAVLDLIGQRLLDNVRTVRRQTGSHLQQLQRLLRRHVQFVRQNQAIPRLVLSDGMTSRNPGRKQRVLSIIQSYLHEVAELTRAGQQAGEIRRELDPDTIALQLLGIVQPGAVLWHLSDGNFDVTRHAERAWQLFRAAIAQEPTA